MNKLLKDFLDSQKLLIISTSDSDRNPWIANVYFSCNDDLGLLFFSSPKSKHSEHIKNNSNVAFSTVWFDENNLGNRKGIQGRGECRLIEDLDEIEKHLENHYKSYPSWKDSINIESIKQNKIESRPYLITPSYIKFWNDEEFGDDKTKEYTF